MDVVRGNPISVCKRLLATMDAFELTNAIVVLGDNPWLEAKLAGHLYNKLLQNQHKFWVTPTPELGENKTSKYLPTGTRLQAVNKTLLKAAVSNLESDAAGEHLALVLKQNAPDQTESVLEVDYGYDYDTASLYNISVNTQKDYTLARNILDSVVSTDIETIYEEYRKQNEI